MTYQTVSGFAQTWGLVFLVVMFLIALAYALWPGNRDRFSRAAQLPLEDDGGPGDGSGDASGDGPGRGPTKGPSKGHGAS